MSDRTRIEWTDATWNPIAGCSRVSEGCRNCYAEGIAARGLPGFEGLAHFVDRSEGACEARWTGAVMVREHLMDQPLKWRRPRRIFVNSMSDLFHDAVPDEVIDRIFAVMALCPQHTFQILTKRPERMRRYLEGDWSVRVYNLIAGNPRGATSAGWLAAGRPLPHVWIGVSVEDQATADVRISHLLETPAAVRFVSAEPLLGPIDFRNVGFWVDKLDALTGVWEDDNDDTGSSTSWGRKPKLDGIFVGGESGPRARPVHPDWVRSIRDQCAATGTPFMFKQWGVWAPRRQARKDDLVDARKSLILSVDRRTSSGLSPYLYDAWIVDRVGKRAAGRTLDDREHNGMPKPRQQADDEIIYVKEA